jgi:hypothetical protein
MRGRKLIPMHLKLIRGNPGKRAVLREPEPAQWEKLIRPIFFSVMPLMNGSGWSRSCSA